MCKSVATIDKTLIIARCIGEEDFGGAHMASILASREFYNNVKLRS